MSRTKRTRLEPQTPPATLDDAVAVVEITDAAVSAIIATAASRGLDGAPWDPDVLHPQIAEIVARALRRTPEWWERRAEGEPN
jgi:hypothetical protein